jgi:hypothetical protein
MEVEDALTRGSHTSGEKKKKKGWGALLGWLLAAGPGGAYYSLDGACGGADCWAEPARFGPAGPKPFFSILLRVN